MIVQKELVAIYDYEVPVPEDPFSFRLEIHKCSELFTGSVYRLERFRLRPTFHQRDREDVDPQINDALIYIRDECNDERKLRGESPEPVIVIFNCELQNIFNQLIEYYFIKGKLYSPLDAFQFARYFNKSINRNRATNSSSTAMSTVNFCVSVSIRSPY